MSWDMRVSIPTAKWVNSAFSSFVSIPRSDETMELSFLHRVQEPNWEKLANLLLFEICDHVFQQLCSQTREQGCLHILEVFLQNLSETGQFLSIGPVLDSKLRLS